MTRNQNQHHQHANSMGLLANLCIFHLIQLRNQYPGMEIHCPLRIEILRHRIVNITVQDVHVPPLENLQ
jgi:hypothetical protein